MHAPDPPSFDDDHAQLDELAQLVQGALLRYHTDADGRGRLVYISAGSLDIWGLHAADVLRDETLIWLMAPRAERDVLRRVFLDATVSLAPWVHEWRIVDTQGRTKWLRGSGKARALVNGGQRWTVYVSDVTDSVRARQLEGTGQTYLRAVFDNVPGLAVQAFGPDRRIDYWNRGSEMLYGHTAQDALTHDITDLLALPNEREMQNTFLQHMLANGIQHHSAMLWQRRRDGSLIEVSTNVIQVVHPEHGPHFISIDFDLTDRRRAEDERLALQAQLRESQKLEALGTLAGGIAHDFNNILAAILGNARLAQEDARTHPLIAESVNEILKAGARAKDLVQRILAFSRRQAMQRRALALASVVDESVLLLRATIPKGVELQVRCDPATPLVMGDPTQLQQVLLNLCTNAWQAMPERSRGRLGITLAPHTGAPPERGDGVVLPGAGGQGDAWPPVNVCLSVSDNGMGMGPETMARLFEPFFTTKPAGEGTGLGLAVVHGILRDHQAVAHVRSQPGQGTVFDVYFRAADAQAPATDLTSSDAPAGPTPAQRERSAVTLLFVDDDELVADLMQRMLKRAGFKAHVYTQPLEALRAVRSGEIHYDVAITDHSMPGMSGLDLARALRALHPDREIALTTGHMNRELRQQVPAAGISVLIDKPNTGDELIAAIDRLVERRRWR